MIAYKDKDTMVDDMIAYAVAQGCPVTDFNPGSVLRTLFEASAWIISGYSAEVRVDWQTALKDFIYTVFSFTKKTGTSATCGLVFSSTLPVAADTPIPVGTRARTVDNIEFQTTVAGVILSGNTSSAPVQASSVVVGDDKNVVSNSITIMVSTISGVNAVTNTTAAVGGTAAETDSEYQSRFSIFVSNLAKSTLKGLESAAKSVAGVKYAYAEELTGVKATGSVKFYASPAPTTSLTIPKGTRVATAGGVSFITTAVGVILAGAGSSTAIAVAAISPGINGNVGVGTIAVITDPVAGVTSVSNDYATTGGTDGELGKTNLYVDDGSGSVPSAVMSEVVKVIEGDPNDRTNYPGARAAGTVIYYRTPTVILINITQTVYVAEGVDSDSTKTAVQDAQSSYLNELAMNSPVVIEKLKSAALGVQGVKDITISIPSANVAIVSGQIAKPGVFTTTILGFSL